MLPLPAVGFAWGEDNWNALVWGKVAVANWIMQVRWHTLSTPWLPNPCNPVQGLSPAF